jgi:hypothetical protein
MSTNPTVPVGFALREAHQKPATGRSCFLANLETPDIMDIYKEP